MGEVIVLPMTHLTFERDGYEVTFVYNDESKRVVAFNMLPLNTMGTPVNQLVLNLTVQGWTEKDRRKVIYEPEIRHETDEEISIRDRGKDRDPQ